MSRFMTVIEQAFTDSLERARRTGKLEFFNISAVRDCPPFTTYANLPGLSSCGMMTISTELTHFDPISIRHSGLAFYADFAGHLDISINGRTYVVPTGKMLVSRPDQHAATHPATDFLNPGSYGWLCLTMKTDAAGHWIWPKWVTLPHEFLHEIEVMIRALKIPTFDVSPAFQECCKFVRYTFTRRHHEASFNARLAPFITLLIVEIHDILAGQPPLEDDPPEAQKALRAVERVTKTLPRRYMDKSLTIEMLAKESGLCRSRFSKLFARLTGETPRQYILSLRMEEVKRLLATTNESVADIAQKVGFLSSSRLFEFFKAKTDLAPLDYRHATHK